MTGDEGRGRGQLHPLLSEFLAVVKLSKNLFVGKSSSKNAQFWAKTPMLVKKVKSIIEIM